MQLSLCEVVHSVQYDSQAIQDVCEISGRLTCKADVDKVPEVTITLESDRPLTNITTHSCILSGDFSDSSTLSRRLKFQPPAQTIDLLHYKIDQTNMPVPIRGFYQMKEASPTCLKFLLQIQLNKVVKNQFEHCTIFIPFYNRGLVESLNATPTHGNMTVAENKRGLVWQIGPRFPPKGLEVRVPATVNFDARSEADESLRDLSAVEAEDAAFCVGLNSFVSVSFKIVNFTLSGTKTDPPSGGSVTLYPAQQKARLNTAISTVSGMCRIWNSLGKARHCEPPPLTR
eukprot:m.127252 g.127252  ORF g.127252 m.127252 type:complete len:286 (+) comp23534_c0_seq4:612-1469(+)